MTEIVIVTLIIGVAAGWLAHRIIQSTQCKDSPCGACGCACMKNAIADPPEGKHQVTRID